VTVSADRNRGATQLGWLVVTLDDANGSDQAGHMPLGGLK
jgi:hypothetical protein